jgi:hypothetical protein
MSTRTSMFALAAIAILSSTALAPTSASALGFGGHVGGVHFSGHFGAHFGGYNHLAFNHWQHFCPLDGRCPPLSHPEPPYPPRYPHPWPHIGVGVATAVASGSEGTSGPSSGPAPSGSCLTKRELPDGDALFKDRCTGEKAESQPQSQPQGGGPGAH